MTELTLAHYTNLLDAVGEDYAILPLQDGASALITRRGGRVLGLFSAPDAPNLFWTSKAFDSPDAFQAFIYRTDGWHWNLGGERVWIAPEITYNVRDRRDFAGTWDIPRAMDPGDYRLSEHYGIRLYNSFRLTSFHHGEPQGIVHVETFNSIEKGENPIAAHPIMQEQVSFIGYENYVNLKYLPTPDTPTSVIEAWNLVQLNAGGTLLIPTIGDALASDYVKPVPAFARQVKDGVLHLPLNGRDQFKVGYKALCMTGRMGYLHTLFNGQAYLLVRIFDNNLLNHYAEEPPDEPGNSGHSVHIYNDNGLSANGQPFCEMECNAATLPTSSQPKLMGSGSRFRLWAYVGAPDAVREIARLLLGSAP